MHVGFCYSGTVRGGRARSMLSVAARDQLWLRSKSETTHGGGRFAGVAVSLS